MIAANAFMWTGGIVGALAILSLLLIGLAWGYDAYSRRKASRPTPPLSIVITCDARQVVRDFRRAEKSAARLARKFRAPQIPEPKPETLTRLYR